MVSSGVVARNVRTFREDRGLSASELARRAGLAKQTVASIETGGGNPTIGTLEALAAVLDVSLRALLSEMGTEVLVQPGDAARWHEQNGLSVRPLDRAFGSGYVHNSVLRLEASRGPSLHRPASRGSLRHAYVAEGRLRLGPADAPYLAKAGDFLRFPADTAHVFEAVTPVAVVVVCTTAPQLSMEGGGERYF